MWAGGARISGRAAPRPELRSLINFHLHIQCSDHEQRSNIQQPVHSERRLGCSRRLRLLLLSAINSFLLPVSGDGLCQKLKSRQTQLQSGTPAQCYLLPSMPQIGAMWALRTAGSLLRFWKISWVPQGEPSLINIHFSHSLDIRRGGDV